MKAYFKSMMLHSYINKLISSILFIGAVCVSVAQDAGTIPILSSSAQSHSVRYIVKRSLRRSPTEVDRLFGEKKRQYDDLVSKGSVSRQAADEFLAGVRGMELQLDERSTVDIWCENGRWFASSLADRDKTYSWTFLEASGSVSHGWSRGDQYNISSPAAPYILSDGGLPILPIQLGSLNTFTDIERSDGGFVARMISVSTGNDSYLPCQLIFANGRLKSAEIRGVERWVYSDYKSNRDPFPGKIEMFRLYDSSGNPQVHCIYSRVPSPKRLPQVDDLLGKVPVKCVDSRSYPPLDFTYVPGRGSIFSQAQSGTPLIMPNASISRRDSPTDFAVFLTGSGLVLLGIASTVLVVRKARAKR